jgi:hypothetical protein
LFANGLTATQRLLVFDVPTQGPLAVDVIRHQLALAPVIAALSSGNRPLAEKIASALPDSSPSKKFATPILTTPFQRPTSSDAKELFLTDLRPTVATVGWGKPAFDFSPEELLIRSGGVLVPRGIYAHPPSTYSWDLNGAWKSFQSSCGLHDTFAGSVEFIVKLDGAEKWRSGVLRKRQLKTCDLNVTGAQKIELIVENGGDGNNADHGYWIAPLLRR